MLILFASALIAGAVLAFTVKRIAKEEQLFMEQLLWRMKKLENQRKKSA